MRDWLRSQPAIAAAVGLVLTACSRQEPTASTGTADVPEQITRGFTTVESDSGKTRYVFRARVARKYADNLTRAEGIQVDFYAGDRVVSVLTSDRGRLEGGRMVAEGNVVVRRIEDDAVLQTNSLYWDDERQKIRTEEVFKITEDGDVVTGSGLTTDPDFKLVEIEDPIVTIPDPEKR